MKNKNVCCFFYKKFIKTEWKELRKTWPGVEIAHWRIAYWKEAFKETPHCSKCLNLLNACQKEGLPLNITENKEGKLIWTH